MIRINYKSDFTIASTISESYQNLPFRFVYYVPNGMKTYEVSYDGSTYTNCKVLGDGTILSIINIHNGENISPIGLGRLKVERYFYLDNENYADGTENLCSNEYTDIVLVEGASDRIDNITDTIYFPMENYLLKPIILEIDLSYSNSSFANVADFHKVHSAMQDGTPINFCIRVSYASGSKFVFYPTCVKANYISLNAKAGSCELHVSDDGTFTKSGTNLW